MTKRRCALGAIMWMLLGHLVWAAQPVRGGQFDDVLFYASFDKGLNAEIAKGDGAASAVPDASGLPAAGAPGRRFFGNAADFGRIRHSRAVRYAASGNIDPRRGSIELWWRPHNGGEIVKSETIFSLRLDKAHGIYLQKGWGGPNGGFLRFIYRNGASNAVAGKYCGAYVGGTWQHFIASWDERSQTIALFVNGKFIAEDKGFAPLPRDGLARSYCVLGESSGCVMDEVIIRNTPRYMTSPYSNGIPSYDTPVAALNASAETVAAAKAWHRAIAKPPAVAEAKTKRFGIVMDVTGMIRDRMYHDEASYGKYVEAMAENGFTHLILRVSDMGDFTYATKIERRASSFKDPSMDHVLKAFDHLAALVRFGHRAGLKIYVWHTMFDEGYYPPPKLGGDPTFEVGGWVYTNVDPKHPWAHYTKFARANPDKLCRHRDGRPNALFLSYAYPEVRAYRTALIKETMDYGIDGVILDTVRWAWQEGRYSKGIYDDENCTLMGYDPPILKAWAAAGKPAIETVGNSNPEWLKFRAGQGMTQFLRELKPLTAARGVQLGVNVFTGSNMARSLVDVQTWIDERLVDVVHPYTWSALPWRHYEAAKRFVEMANGRVLIVPTMISMWPDQERLSLPIMSAPLNAGAAGLILYEAEAVHEGHYQAMRTLKGIGSRR